MSSKFVHIVHYVNQQIIPISCCYIQQCDDCVYYILPLQLMFWEQKVEQIII